jgi:MFS family permease
MLSEAQLAVEVERNYRWNFWFNMLDGVAFWLGLSFASASTIMPLFLSKLTPNPLAIGVLAVLAQGGWFLPQLFTANIVEQIPRKKPLVINVGFFLERLPFWAITGTAVLAATSPKIAVVLFLIAYAWHVVGAGVVATAWQDLVARCFPVDRRGRFFGITNFLGTGAGTLGAAISARLLTVASFPTNFVYTFALAAFLITLSWVFLAQTREPVQAITQPPKSNREFWSKLLDIVRCDHNFRRFLIARMVMALGGMGGGFLTVAAVQRWHVPDGVVGLYTGVTLIGQTLGNLAFGFLADRYGHKLSLVLGGVASVSGFALAWLAPSPAWYYLVFTLLGITTGALIVSGLLMVMEFSTAERRPTYVGLANTGIGLLGAIAPLLGAALVTLSYSWLFGVSAAVNLIALMLMWLWVKEPRQMRNAR